MKLRVSRIEEIQPGEIHVWAEGTGSPWVSMAWVIKIAYPEDRKNIPTVGREVDVTIGPWA